jgi:hypothetical protein
MVRTHTEQWALINQEIEQMTYGDWTFDQLDKHFYDNDDLLEEVLTDLDYLKWAWGHAAEELETWSTVLDATMTPMELWEQMKQEIKPDIEKYEAAVIWVWLYRQEP